MLQITLLDMETGTGLQAQISFIAKFFGLKRFDKVIFDRIRARGVAIVILGVHLMFMETYIDKSDFLKNDVKNYEDYKTENA